MFPQESLRRVKPKGASSGSNAKTICYRQGFLKGANPETAVCCAGISLRRGDQQQEKQ